MNAAVYLPHCRRDVCTCTGTASAQVPFIFTDLWLLHHCLRCPGTLSTAGRSRARRNTPQTVSTSPTTAASPGNRFCKPFTARSEFILQTPRLCVCNHIAVAADNVLFVFLVSWDSNWTLNAVMVKKSTMLGKKVCTDSVLFSTCDDRLLLYYYILMFVAVTDFLLISGSTKPGPAR